jgi:alpha-aminoadipic semialdehyde synthase
VLRRLPLEVVEPEELLAARPESRHALTAVTFREQHIAEPRGPEPFDLQRYYDYPEHFRPAFEPYLPQLDVLVNAIYWAPQYPRLLTREYLRQAAQAGALRLRVVGDISCDIDGAIECTLRATDPGQPVFSYDPLTGETMDGVTPRGLAVMAVDILPSELPREASEDFARVLEPFIPALAAADYSAPFDELALPPPIRRAVIAHRGELTPDYRYLLEHLPT